MPTESEVTELLHRIHQGGTQASHDKSAALGKLFARKRMARIIDEGSFSEDGALACCQDERLPADGVITGTARIDGRVVAIMANDSTVKAGSWGPATVEKILRVQEVAMELRCPLLYLVDSAGARITDQVKMFPGRRGAGRIFFNQVQMSGYVPQVCVLFGPSAAGGAYIPAFCDVVVMVEGNASMYLGSPRMAEVVIGEQCSLEQMGGAHMHCTISGCGDALVSTEDEALTWARKYLAYMPSHASGPAPDAQSCEPLFDGDHISRTIPPDESTAYDMMEIVKAVIDDGSWLEIKELYAKELLTGLARIEGRPVGVVANQPAHLGGVLFVESAIKAARFIELCDAFGIPLLFLSDVPGFMIGSRVEQQGIIRAGARMIAAVSKATVAKLCVIVRKAYGAGLYAMCGPAFEPDACFALPSASIGVMGPGAAVNAVYYNKIQALVEGPERTAFVQAQQHAYAQDIDLFKLAHELVVDSVIPPRELRRQVANRLSMLTNKMELRLPKKTSISPM